MSDEISRRAFLGQALGAGAVVAGARAMAAATEPGLIPPNGIHVICLDSLPKRADWPDIIARILDLDYVSGLLVCVDWARLEPAEGEYDWRLFDTPLALAQERGKTVAFSLLVQLFSPPWLMQRCATFTFEHIHPSVGVVTAPIPWDSAYKAALANTVQAISRRIDGASALRYITVNGPSSLFGVETNFPVKTISPDEAAKLAYTRRSSSRDGRTPSISSPARFPARASRWAFTTKPAPARAIAKSACASPAPFATTPWQTSRSRENA